MGKIRAVYLGCIFIKYFSVKQGAFVMEVILELPCILEMIVERI